MLHKNKKNSQKSDSIGRIADMKTSEKGNPRNTKSIKYPLIEIVFFTQR